MTTQARVVGIGDIAGGEDVRIGGPEVFVDHDPVVDVEAGLGGELAVGVIPTPTRTISASIWLPSFRMTPVTAPFLLLSAATSTWQRRSTPWSRCRSAKMGAASVRGHAAAEADRVRGG